jgi:serine/threonine-protein kinase RsbT
MTSISATLEGFVPDASVVKETAQDFDIGALEPLVRRVVAARLRDRDAVDDIVQETLTRLIEVRDRLDPEALTPYAVVTARNLTASLARKEDRHRRHAHKLVDFRPAETPDEQVLEREESRAVAAALTKLSEQERKAVVDHELMEVDTATLARELRSTPGGVAVRLARARAKMRVDYVVALRDVELPTDRCRPVLIALSAGDRRRQVALDAGTHILQCPVCASLSQPLMERSRALAALLPLPGVGKAAGALGRRLQSTPAQVGAATATVAAVAVVVLLVTGEEPPPQPPQRPAAAVVVGSSNRPALPLAATGNLARFEGEVIRARGARVSQVPANEGFWLGSGRERLWVQLVVDDESRFRVRPGDRVSFRGTLVSHRRDFPQQVGVDPSEGAAFLRDQAHHVEVQARDIELAGQGSP